MSDAWLAVVNPAAGGGRCGKLAPAALEKLSSGGIPIEVVHTRAKNQAWAIARDAWRGGYRRFLAVGGDGTAFEIVNGVFAEAPHEPERPRMAFLPLGSGNSFLRDFTTSSVEYATQALLENRQRPCDVLRLVHRRGVLHFINLVTFGFASDAAVLRDRTFRSFGTLGYWLAVLVCLARLQRRPFPLRADGDAQLDTRRCLFLSFSNTKFTGGNMMIAPDADPFDGLIEYVRWGPVGRLRLMANLPGLYSGAHIRHPLAERRGVKQVEFALDAPVDVMIDGEVATVHPERLEVLPGALLVAV